MSRKEIFLLFFIITITSCARISPDLEYALSAAGENRSNLEKVLEHYSKYPEDSLKYQAACFLITHMPGKCSEENVPTEIYHGLFEQWRLLSQGGKLLVEKEVSDSLITVFGLNFSRKPLPDILHISSSFLINNIERAFEVRHSTPWGKDIPFDVFCEEILPYRIVSEPLEYWRDTILEQYKSLYDSLQNTHADVVEASICILDAMGTTWDEVNNFSTFLPSMNYSMLHALRVGSCAERVKYGIYVLRAMGIPTTFDFTPQWPFRSMGHTWCTIRDKNGKYIPFIPIESKPIEGLRNLEPRMAKAYRYTYASNQQSLAYIAKNQIIPSFFRNAYMQDVSATNHSDSRRCNCS
jgi:hypothetical protein